jgi:5'-3' exonuclease
VREKLEHDREQAFFCEHMAKLVCDIALPVEMSKLSLTDVPVAQVMSLFRELEFSVLTKRFESFVKSEYGSKHFRRDELANAQPVKTKSESQPSLF